MRVARVGEDSQSESEKIRKIELGGARTGRRQEEGGGSVVVVVAATNLFVGIGT